jgi:hypothetical protein
VSSRVSEAIAFDRGGVQAYAKNDWGASIGQCSNQAQRYLRRWCSAWSVEGSNLKGCRLEATTTSGSSGSSGEK